MFLVLAAASFFISSVLFNACASEEERFQGHLASARENLGARRYDDALSELRHAQNIHATDKDLLFYLSSTHEGLGNIDSAIAYLKQCLSLYGPDREKARQVYRLAVMRNQWDVAIAGLNILSSTTEPRDSVLELFYTAYRSAGYWEAALEVADTLIARHTDNPEFFLRRGLALATLGRFDDAHAVLKDIEAKFGESVEVWSNRGALLAQTGDIAGSEQAFRRAVLIDTMRSSSWANLGNVLSASASLPKKREALRCYRRVDEALVVDMRLDTIMKRLEVELGDTLDSRR